MFIYWYDMKAILSPYNDNTFNKYLLKYIKQCLRDRSSVFIRDDENRQYFLEDSKIGYTDNDIIDSLTLNGKLISFSNKKLVDHAVYDLSQRFWYEEMNRINNEIHMIYLKFQKIRDSVAIQQRRSSLYK